MSHSQEHQQNTYSWNAKRKENHVVKGSKSQDMCNIREFARFQFDFLRAFQSSLIQNGCLCQDALGGKTRLELVLSLLLKVVSLLT